MPKPQQDGNKKGVFKTILASVIIIATFGLPYLYGVSHTKNLSPLVAYPYTFKTFGDAAGRCIESVVDSSKECKLTAPGIGGIGTGAGGALSEPALPNKPAKKDAEAITAYGKALDNLKVAKAEDAEYTPAEWNIWATNNNGCTTRAEVLKAQGKDVTTKDNDPASCDITSGNWTGIYDGTTFSVKPGEDPTGLRKNISVDHVISPKYAATHGAKDWDAEKKEAFANDTSQLLVVSADSAKAKDGKSPAGYMPQSSEQCRYSQLWIDTATKYDLSITQADKSALQKGLQTCNS